MAMKAYVWEGPGVLRNYGSGKAVVIAETVAEAWMELKALDERAYYQLRLGNSYITSEHEYNQAYENVHKRGDPYGDAEYLTPAPGFPKTPKELSLGVKTRYSRDPDRVQEFFGMVCWGGE